jgi:putative phage-type endonuclease
MYDVTIDRNIYIGGSDLPIIMGISPFKSRFDLLLEKAGYLENDFKGNEYTEYGNVLEPLVRNHINETEKDKYIEDKIIQDDLRYHSDGFNGKSVLEIKTTSQIKEDVNDYKIYLVQLLMGMQIHGVKKGKLAVYERPKDFNKDFDESKLKVYEIDIKNYKELVEDINLAIEQFRVDLAKVKENPLITEEDLQPKELIKISNEVVALELKLKEYKDIEKEQAELKSQLKIAMQKYGVKKWITPNDTKITLVADGEDKEVEVFNADNFKKDNEKLYKKYLEKKIKKGKIGYVKITLKEEI